MEIETIRKIEEIQAKILDNLDANRPASDGIDMDELRDLIAKIRSDRSKPTTVRTKSSKKLENKPSLDSLFE